MNEKNETHKRSIMKAITWRVLASVATVLLVLAFTGRVEIALSVGFIEVIAKVAIYYGHERIWNVLKWGKSD
jgi:adenylylsulfate kinase